MCVRGSVFSLQLAMHYAVRQEAESWVCVCLRERKVKVSVGNLMNFCCAVPLLARATHGGVLMSPHSTCGCEYMYVY